MRFRRLSPAAFTFALAAGVVACADHTPLSPDAAAALPAPAWVGDAFAGRPSFSDVTMRDLNDMYADANRGAVTVSSSGDTTYAKFVVQPDEERKYVFGGGHSIVFPRRAICDPARSSYGPAYWNSPCPVVGKDVTVTLRTYPGPDGHPRADFWPRLRFSPSLSVGVMLRFKDAAAAAAQSATIRFCPVDGSSEGCVDEAATDASLQTYQSADGATVYRRVKHFSGYSVGVGRESEY
jgi:hypothetical protein